MSELLIGFKLGSFDIFFIPQIDADLHRIFDRITKKKSEIRRQNSERRGAFVHVHLLWPKCTIRPAKKDFLLDVDLQEFTKILSSPEFVSCFHIYHIFQFGTYYNKLGPFFQGFSGRNIKCKNWLRMSCFGGIILVFGRIAEE